MTDTLRKPEWLKKKIDFDKNLKVSTLIKTIGLHTVCQEAKCPNISECFKNAHATFLILGKYCTRHCSFCAVEKSKPLPLDPKEPKKIAAAVKKMKLKHVVITSVTRDDLLDAGASVFAKTVSEIKKISKNIHIELLIPDLKGDRKALHAILESPPDILGHNVETVPRLYALRPRASYQTSLEVLKAVKEIDKNIYTKSALLLGLGENEGEVMKVMEDLQQVGCDFLAIGQYLRPTLNNVPVAEYIHPDKFDKYCEKGLALGFKHIESHPYVRSSFRASAYLSKAKKRKSSDYRKLPLI